MFITKKFKENNHYEIPEILCEYSNRNIKIQNVFYIVKVSKSIQPINVFNNFFY
jgi:hypothetical protein